MNAHVPPPEVEIIGEPCEDSFATAYTEQTHSHRRFDVTRQKWFNFDGTRWAEDRTGVAKNDMRQIIRAHGADDPAKFCKNSAVSGALALAASDPRHAVTSDIWDSDPLLLGTPGGTVDLRTGKLRRAMADDYITRLTGCTPEDGEPERWLRFLDEATAGDRDLVRFLQSVFGYCLTGLINEHALFFIYGPGGNGKSVFLNVLDFILGNYATTAAMTAFTANRNEQHPTDLAMLDGPRLVSASETEEGKPWAESRIKHMTGGDQITARFMRQDFFTFHPKFKLVIVGNHAPALINIDEAMKRRFNIIPFTHKPSQPDSGLEVKLRKEAGRILSWAIVGCLDWQTDRLVRPKVVADATAGYFEEQNILSRWIAERCTRDATKWELSATVNADWAEFARAEGEDPRSAKWLAQALRREGIAPGKGAGGVRIFSGIRINLRQGGA